MHRVIQSVSVWLVVLAALLPAQRVWAQVQGVLLDVQREYLGLGDYARLGAWTPVRVTLENQGSEPRQVLCRWLLEDVDGDRVTAQRRVTLDALSTQYAWLYGPLPVRSKQNELWTIQVLNEDASEELARAEVSPARTLAATDRMIGIAGNRDFGLSGYTTGATTHEPIQLVSGLSLSTLPDRWYGLSAIDTLVWSRDGGDPDDPLVTSEIQQALREWVRRGGHLVIVLPAYGETWTGSALADLLPVKPEQVRRIEGRPPSWLGAIRSQEVMNVEMNVFDVGGDTGVDIVIRHDNQPIVVAKRYGFGRVSLIGLDLADPRFAQMGLPNGPFPIWHDVFMWQAPVYEQARIDTDVANNKMSRPDQRTRTLLGRFIPGRISMRGAAAPALLAAILVFGLYWFVAGPLSVIALNKKDAQRHSWVVFVGIVLCFSAISWAGAWLMAPKQAAVSHFTILRAGADSPAVHAHSWFSVYIPKFARQTIELDPDHPTNRNVLASPGLVAGLDETGFLDPQTYTLDMASPREVEVPFRSTAKQFEADFLGRIDQPQTGMAEPLILPQGEIKLDNNWPAGKLSHGLPGPLRDVVVIYCPGEDLTTGKSQTPFVWRLKDPWEPKQVIDLGTPDVLDRLVLKPKDTGYTDRKWLEEGFLGKLIDSRPGKQLMDAAGVEVITTSTEMIQFIQLLAFFDALPPPDFRKTGLLEGFVFNRGLGRELDLTPMFAGRRLIVMGHLEDSPLPIPMTVEGEEVSSTGWTVVQWVYDLE